MTLPDFKNLDDLTGYLTNQEKRIRDLERANAELISEIKKRFIQKDELSAIISESTPRTGLFSDSFLKRSFTVWGHCFIAQLLISIPIFIVYLVIFVFLLTASNR
jgi:hypothetical protein